MTEMGSQQQQQQHPQTVEDLPPSFRKLAQSLRRQEDRKDAVPFALNRGENLSFLQRTFLKTLWVGRIPKHVAFIMDGNRRYARNLGKEVKEGHETGLDKLVEVLHWVMEAGIESCTVYAFSIENFKRAKKEVDDLLDIFRKFIRYFFYLRRYLRHKGVRISFIGKLELLPEDVQGLAAVIMKETMDYEPLAFLNIAASYTNREEMTSATRTLAKGFQAGYLTVGDFSERLFELCLYTGDKSEVDLLVRTSGEVRYSDFMMWQNNYGVFYSQKVLWPNITVWNFLRMLFSFQIDIAKVERLATHRRTASEELNDDTTSAGSTKKTRIRNFLSWVEAEKREKLDVMSLLVPFDPLVEYPAIPLVPL